MVAILLVTGFVWLLDIFILSKKRPIGNPEPMVVEYSKSFFPVILFVFVVRSFIIEPFKIPSGSMMPTLLAGDFILVNKFDYGLRVPILNNIFIDISHPKRGDVFVFHYPPDPSIDYIKRVVGLPGDKIVYQDKRLTINGQLLDVTNLPDYEYSDSGLNLITVKRFNEDLTGKKHDILVAEFEPSVNINRVDQFPHRENCDYNESGFSCTVPPGHYFAMGDNRDNSKDSRYWGFVPENNLVGKAFFIWWNFDDLKRIGTSIQ